MTDPMRWRDQGADAFEVALLASADADAGSRAARVRSLAALGATSGRRGVHDAGIGCEGGGRLGSLGRLSVKWLGVGAIVGLGSLAAAQGLGPRRAPSLMLSGVVATVGARASQSHRWVPRVQHTPAKEEVLEATASDPDAENAPHGNGSSSRPALLDEGAKAQPSPPRGGEAESATVRRAVEASDGLMARRSPAPSEPRSLREELSREVALLDQARGLLSRGQPRAAIAVLERRDREIRSGVLGPEARLLKVEALLRSGNRRGAEAVAKRELSRHPRGPHADRLLALLGEQKP